MMQFRLRLWAVCLLVSYYLSLGTVQAQNDDEVIDLQDLLLDVSKSLAAFSKEFKTAFQGFSTSLNSLKQDMTNVKSSLQEIKTLSTTSSTETKDISQHIKTNSEALEKFEDILTVQLQKSLTTVSTVSQELRDHFEFSSNHLYTFSQTLEEQNKKTLSALKTFEELLRQLSKDPAGSCPAYPEKIDTILSRLNDIRELSIAIRSSSQVVKDQIEKQTSSISTVIQSQKDMKETITNVKEITNQIQITNNQVHQGSTTCSASIEKFLKEQQIWKETLTNKIDIVVEKHGTCDKDKDKDGDKDNDKDNGGDGGDDKEYGPVIDCADLYKKYGYQTSAVYNIIPLGYQDPFPVFCDMSDGGGWIVIQRRGEYGNSRDYFFKTWNEYKNGFGDLNKEFWLGNDKIASVTNQGSYQVKIDLWDEHQNHAFARYNDFKIETELSRYKLRIGGYSGTAGDALNKHNGLAFSTQDRDSIGRGRCDGDERKTGWWYGNCASNLNGLGLRGDTFQFRGQGIKWTPWLGATYSLRRTIIKIRPKNF